MQIDKVAEIEKKDCLSNDESSLIEEIKKARKSQAEIEKLLKSKHTDYTNEKKATEEALALSKKWEDECHEKANTIEANTQLVNAEKKKHSDTMDELNAVKKKLEGITAAADSISGRNDRQAEKIEDYLEALEVISHYPPHEDGTEAESMREIAGKAFGG